MTGAGPTGNFPDGMLTRADEGELRIAVTHYKGRVVFEFGKAVAWIGLKPEEADALADALSKHAHEARVDGDGS